MNTQERARYFFDLGCAEALRVDTSLGFAGRAQWLDSAFAKLYQSVHPPSVEESEQLLLVLIKDAAAPGAPPSARQRMQGALEALLDVYRRLP